MMDRKQFLSFLALSGVILPLKGRGRSASAEVHQPELPPYLMPGDTIGITSPSGHISEEAIKPSVQLMESWGFKTRTGKTIGTRDFIFGGTDQARVADMQSMLDDPGIKAIMCARGGYGVVRIIDQLSFNKFRSKPKWIIGFNDITALHTHINSNFEIATIHSKMCNSFPDDWTKATPMQIETILSIRQVLSGEETRYTAPASAYNRNGKADGVLVGGNLSIIETLAGTRSDLDTRHKILFVEDTNEELYSIDRMFWNLKRSGKLDKLRGLIIGGFKLKAETPGEEFGRSVYEIVKEKVKEYDYPVCFDFPVGHQVNNYALKCGAEYSLHVEEAGSLLTSL